MIDRRVFVLRTGSAVLLLELPTAACGQGTRANVGTYIPGRIFFATKSLRTPVSLAALELTEPGNAVLGVFSNGKTIRFDSKSPRVLRHSIVHKSLAGWVIDAVWQSLRNKRDQTTATQLRRSFEQFQRQSVLQAVTPVSLYNLVRDSLGRERIKAVRWSRAALRFEVE
jgi:hypothetical protein